MSLFTPKKIAEPTVSTYDRTRADYIAALAKLDQEFGKSGISSMKGFETTKMGQKLGAELRQARIRKQSVDYFMEKKSVDLGEVFVLEELPESAREAVFRAAAAYGIDTPKWPDDVRRALTLQCRAERLERHDVLADSRRNRLKGELATAVDAVLAKYGSDPNAWPNKVLDELSLIELRIVAFNRLVSGAIHRDSGWGSDRAPIGTVEPVTPGPEAA